MDDSRYKTRQFLAAHILDANITKDDDATEANWISHFSAPTYPLYEVFYGSKNVDGIFSIGTPTTTAKVKWDGTIIGYKESVPIEICTVTKQGISGDKLRWKMEAEVRRITQENPKGSYRSIRSTRPTEEDMGGWKLFKVEYILTHERDTT